MYYITYNIVTIIFVSLHFLHVFNIKDECVYEVIRPDDSVNSLDVSMSFQLMITVSLILHLINLMIGLIVEPCVRIIRDRQGEEDEDQEEEEDDDDDPEYTPLQIMGLICDFIYRLGFFIFTIVILFWLDSPGVHHCTSTQPDPFANEATWIR